MRVTEKSFALFNFGFRPFYLLAALFAAFIIPLWGSEFLGHNITSLREDLPADLWHAHEMLFGYTGAVIVGFLFTAVARWTGRPMPQGWVLAGFCIIWIVARLQFSLNFLPIFMWADLLFMPLAAVAVARNVLLSRNYRNMAVVGILLMLSILNAVFYYFKAYEDYALMRDMMIGAMNVVVVLMVFIGGRVIPFFTGNALPHVSPRKVLSLEIASIACLFVLIIAELFLQDIPKLLGVIALLSCVLHGARLWLWRGYKAFGNPLLWILHVGYLWIVISFALKGWHYFDSAIPYSMSIHAVALGAIGALTLGMMTRTSKGHTGRILKAHRWDVVTYIAITSAVVVRISGGLFWSDFYALSIILSAALWSVACAIFFVSYFIPLMTPRIDGKPG